MAQQIEFTMQRLSQGSSGSNQGKEKHINNLDETDSRNKVLHKNKIPAYKVHKPKHFFSNMEKQGVA